MKISEKNRLTKLRPAEMVFVEEIVAGASQTDAYQKAYPRSSRETARANASKKLADANIQEAVNFRKQIAAELAGISSESVLGALNEIAFASLGDIEFTNYGTIDWERARARGVDHLIKSIRVTVSTKGDVTTHYEMYSRMDALKELVECLGIKQKPRENDLEIDKIARAFKSWCNRYSHASDEQRQ